MGSSLSVADIDNDGYADVVTGVPGEDIGRVKDAGSVLILKGSAQALTGTGATVFSQESPGVPGILERGDRFGEAVTIVGSTANERAQLAVGDPDENAGDGAAWVLHGVKTGPTTTGAIAFGPSGVGAPADTAQFGAALSHR
ncbi:FG-GAP repeat protein [Actinacidiphila oryziradicis]|uniref:FG-GAP repeat protein n=1 Tax=Actinacidiphila oryziradicis TaxID=2571141 RepID=A0A4U0SUL2_9ACTN|nr:FG-GAP repeat protein [Actinacidiphila oryziradicis]TKA13233.1 hypothetical protein FCI23_00385 [Actinacidiphila oryziradicis]